MNIPDRYWTGEALLEMGIPWLTPNAIKFLNNLLSAHPEYCVVEFGSGGSTAFFGERCQKVVSWEQDAEWRAKVSKRIAGMTNVMLTDDLGSILGTSFDFDILLVDSDHNKTNREDIARKAIGLLKAGGWFVLDNYGRYKIDFISGWERACYDDPHWSGKGTLIAQKK